MKLLVIVDAQNDFINGTLGTVNAQEIVSRIVDKVNNYDNKNDTLVLFTKDTHDINYFNTLEGKMLPVAHCIENTTGWSINKEIKNAVRKNRFLSYSSNEIINSRIYKHTFGSDVLENFLIKHKDIIDEVEFIGLCTDICVISNVLLTRQKLPDTRIIVDSSCCAGSTPEKHYAALEVMRSCQIEVK